MCFTCIISFRSQNKPKRSGLYLSHLTGGGWRYREVSDLAKVTHLVGGGCQGQEGEDGELMFNGYRVLV